MPLQKLIFLVADVGSVQYDDERMNDVQPSILSPVDFTTSSIWNISPSLSTPTIRSERILRKFEGLYTSKAISALPLAFSFFVHVTAIEFRNQLEGIESDVRTRYRAKRKFNAIPRQFSAINIATKNWPILIFVL